MAIVTTIGGLGMDGNGKEGCKWKTKIRTYHFSGPNADAIAERSRRGENIDSLVEAFRDDFAGVHLHEGNVACVPGLQELINIFFGLAVGQVFDAAHTYIGAGDGNGSAVTPTAADTGLTAPTNKAYVVMDGTYPSRTNQTVSLRATFGAGVGTFYWREIAIRNASSEASGKQLNHLAYDKGAKAAGDVFIPLIEMTFS